MKENIKIKLLWISIQVINPPIVCSPEAEGLPFHSNTMQDNEKRS